MKFVHLSDLHIGKKVNEFSMLQDQEYILQKILDIVKSENPDAVLIAGDIYDKFIPSAEAVTLFDDFLFSLSETGTEIFIISGNHDSAERVAFASRILCKSKVHFSPVYNGVVTPITLKDEFGAVHFYLLPFIKPANVRKCFPDMEIASYNDAVKAAVDAMQVDEKERNVLITHQFVTGAVCCASEEISVGGTDNVDAEAFDSFDYVALGHIHSPQKVGRDTVRYCGTPLKYSFSEVHHKKSVTIAELGEKGNINLRFIPLAPLRDIVEIKGNYEMLISKQYYEKLNTNDYYHITLTDDEEVVYAISKLRTVYPNIMKLDYDNKRTQSAAHVEITEGAENKSPFSLLDELYEMQNGEKMTQEQAEFAKSLIQQIWEENV